MGNPRECEVGYILDHPKAVGPRSPPPETKPYSCGCGSFYESLEGAKVFPIQNWELPSRPPLSQPWRCSAGYRTPTAFSAC